MSPASDKSFPFTLIRKGQKDKKRIILTELLKLEYKL